MLGPGIRCGKNRVTRLRQRAALRGIHRRSYRGTTQRRRVDSLHPDLVNRKFTATESKQLWVADMTQHRTDEGSLFIHRY